MTFEHWTIGFPGGPTAGAVAVAAPPGAGGDELVAALGLPPPRATVVLNGSATVADPGLARSLAGVIGGAGLAATVSAERLTVVTGATDAGIFSMLGAAMAGRSAPLVGVAPRRLVTWAGGPAGELVALEPHHSHFVLVDGDEWGDETGALLALARALARSAPSVAVICGGGPVTRREALGHVHDGRPLVVLAGSGRFADDLAAGVAGAGPGSDRAAAEIVAGGDVTVVPLDAGGPALGRAVLAALWPA